MKSAFEYLLLVFFLLLYVFKPGMGWRLSTVFRLVAVASLCPRVSACSRAGTWPALLIFFCKVKITP